MPDPRHGPGTDTRGGGPEGTGSCSAPPGPARYSLFNTGIVGVSALRTLQKEPGGTGGPGRSRTRRYHDRLHGEITPVPGAESFPAPGRVELSLERIF